MSIINTDGASNHMEVRPIGRTGLQVSLLGFGAAPLANLYRAVPESEAYETVYAALDQGVTYFDTAPAYGAASLKHGWALPWPACRVIS
jgi:D-threo-aldose 1-dehydrogenase